MEYVQHAHGSQSEYDALNTKKLVSDGTVYFVTDTRRIYLGDILMSELYPNADALQYPDSVPYGFPIGDTQQY